MRLINAILGGALAGSVAALPTSTNHAIHEKRSSSSWLPVEGTKPNGRILLPVRIGLTQSNLDQGHDLLMEVSDPTSDKYSQHWDMRDVSFYHGLRKARCTNLP